MLDPLATSTLSYALLEDEDAVVEAIQADFLAVAEEVVSSTGPIRAAYVGEPAAYGGKWPAWVFYRTTSAGNSRLADAAEKMLAEEYVAQILVLDLASQPVTSRDQSGLAVAEATTRKGFSAWIKRLSTAYDIHGRCTGIVRQGTSSGAFSESGFAMFMDEAQNILWAHSADIRVRL